MAIWRPTDDTPLIPLRTPFGLLADSVEAELFDTGWHMFPGPEMVATSAATITDFSIRKVGKLVSFVVYFTVTNASSSPSTGGDVQNVGLIDVAAPYKPAVGQGGFASVATGRMLAGHIASNGRIAYSAVGGSVPLASGEACSLGGTYFVE